MREQKTFVANLSFGSAVFRQSFFFARQTFLVPVSYDDTEEILHIQSRGGTILEQENELCKRLSGILGGKSRYENGICSVTVERKDIKATIANVPLNPLEHMFHFRSPDSIGESLITGEMVLLEQEVPGVVDSLSNNKIIVSAVHTHWLYDKPKLVYVHIEDIAEPEDFARVVAQVINK